MEAVAKNVKSLKGQEVPIHYVAALKKLSSRKGHSSRGDSGGAKANLATVVVRVTTCSQSASFMRQSAVIVARKVLLL